MPGTLPSTLSAMRAIVGAPSTSWSDTRAPAFTSSGVCPFVARMLLNAIAKQAAWAAAISSSGLVPSPSSKRDLKLYSPMKTPSPTVRSPLPLCRSPHQIALPLRGDAMVSLLLDCLSTRLRFRPRGGLAWAHGRAADGPRPYPIAVPAPRQPRVRDVRRQPLRDLRG